MLQTKTSWLWRLISCLGWQKASTAILRSSWSTPTSCPCFFSACRILCPKLDKARLPSLVISPKLAFSMSNPAFVRDCHEKKPTKYLTISDSHFSSILPNSGPKPQPWIHICVQQCYLGNRRNCNQTRQVFWRVLSTIKNMMEWLVENSWN